MTDSLRDQLLGLGFKPAPRPERAADRKPDQARGKPGARPRAPGADTRGAGRRDAAGAPARRGRGGARTREDIDLAKAYAIRAQKEKDERIEAERQKQALAQQRREARARLGVLVEGKALNAADADIARHFEYGGKIKRIYVTQEQLRELNAGELGVLQHNGRYLLVSAALLAQAEAVFAPAVALKVDPAAPADADPYADPKYQVPDDLVW